MVRSLTQQSPCPGSIPLPPGLPHPTPVESRRAIFICSSVTFGEQVQTVIPFPIWAGVFGIQRTTISCPQLALILSIVAPATIDINKAPGFVEPHIPLSTRSNRCGFTARIMMSESDAASALSELTFNSINGC